MQRSSPALPPAFSSASTAIAGRRRSLPITVLAIAGLASWGASAGADQPLPLAAAVASAARTQIVPALERDGVTSVGVLKFLAVDGSAPGSPISARLGAINSDLAAQFQTAILLNISRKRPIAVLRDLGTVAAGIPDGTHLTADGQRKLFAAEYPVVVGAAGTMVKPDALIFGIVQINDDLRTVTIDVRMIRRDAPDERKLTAFTARLGADALPAVGQSFVATRGLFTGGEIGDGPAAPDQVAERPIRLAALAADVRAGRRKFPLEDPAAPVTLSITYDGVAQRIEYRDGSAFVAEPRQGQQVTVTLKKAHRDGQRYAVALKVNGENTAERGVLPDLTGSKWILSDDAMTLPVKGYSIGTNTVQPFKVLSQAESAKRAFDYGVDAGTITMTVFAEQTGTPEEPAPTPAEAPQIAAGDASSRLDQLLVAGGVRLDPRQNFSSLDEAKGSLHASLASTNRGLIAADTESQSLEHKIVKFTPIPDPIMSVVIRYYTKP